MTTVVSTHNPSAAGDGLTKYVVAKKPPVRFPLKNLLVLASLSPPLVTGGSASLRDPVARHLLSGPSSRAAQPGDYPSVAFLSMEPLDSKSAYRRGCTGTLIAKNNTGGLGVFATAGHCGHPQAVTLNNTHPNDPMAQQRQEGRQWQTVLPGTSQFHPDYAGSNGHQGVDIALHYTLPFTGIDPVRVYRGKLPEVGDTLWSAGFGYAYRVGERPTPEMHKKHLRTGTQPLLGYCGYAYGSKKHFMVVDSHDVALEPGDSGAGVYAQDPAGSGNYHWIAVHHGNLANPVSDKVVKDFDQSSLITPEVITWIEASACLRLNDDGFFVAAPPGCEPQHFARAKHGDTNCDARFVPLTRAQKLVRLVNFGLPSVVAVAISALACLAYRRHQASQGAQVAPAEGSQIELQPLQASAEEA